MVPDMRKYLKRGVAMLIAVSRLETVGGQATSGGSRSMILAMVLIGVSTVATLAWIAMGIWLLSKLF
jgi:hypothetical protein